jgi:predicted RNA-binding Zn-ribbon protein involved in translation (DUF1610 family)
MNTVVAETNAHEQTQKHTSNKVAYHVFTCRECGRDVVGYHESMKCDRCRTWSDNWRDYDY